jgi:hypothetical protein
VQPPVFVFALSTFPEPKEFWRDAANGIVRNEQQVNAGLS